MPSATEPWGLVVNEAMNAGRAMIVSDHVGCGPDLVRNGDNGFVFKAGNVADLSRVLREALASPERCAEMGRRSLDNHQSLELRGRCCGAPCGTGYIDMQVSGLAIIANQCGGLTSSSMHTA